MDSLPGSIPCAAAGRHSSSHIHIGEETIHISDFLGHKIDIDFMFFTTDFIFSCLDKTGFEKIETIEREPYPGVEYESRRAYVFAKKPDTGNS